MLPQSTILLVPRHRLCPVWHPEELATCLAFSRIPTYVIPPLLPLPACMLLLLLLLLLLAVTYLPEIYWWLPRSFGLVK